MLTPCGVGSPATNVPITWPPVGQRHATRPLACGLATGAAGATATGFGAGAAAGVDAGAVEAAVGVGGAAPACAAAGEVRTVALEAGVRLTEVARAASNRSRWPGKIV